MLKNCHKTHKIAINDNKNHQDSKIMEEKELLYQNKNLILNFITKSQKITVELEDKLKIALKIVLKVAEYCKIAANKTQYNGVKFCNPKSFINYKI